MEEEKIQGTEANYSWKGIPAIRNSQAETTGGFMESFLAFTLGQ